MEAKDKYIKIGAYLMHGIAALALLAVVAGIVYVVAKG